MASEGLRYVLIIGITSICSLVVCALVLWRLGFRSTAGQRSKHSPEPIPSSVESRLAQLEADQASLFSTLEKLTTTVKRVSSRHGMRDLREREQREPPPGAPKAQVLRHYGLAGKTGTDFFRRQVDIERELSGDELPGGS